MRTDWLLNDNGVSDGGSDWCRGIGPKSEMEELTIQLYPQYGVALFKQETHHIDLLFHKQPRIFGSLPIKKH